MEANERARLEALQAQLEELEALRACYDEDLLLAPVEQDNLRFAAAVVGSSSGGGAARAVDVPSLSATLRLPGVQLGGQPVDLAFVLPKLGGAPRLQVHTNAPRCAVEGRPAGARQSNCCSVLALARCSILLSPHTRSAWRPAHAGRTPTGCSRWLTGWRRRVPPTARPACCWRPASWQRPPRSSPSSRQLLPSSRQRVLSRKGALTAARRAGALSRDRLAAACSAGAASCSTTSKT